jgi:predicted phage tail protein
MSPKAEFRTRIIAAAVVMVVAVSGLGAAGLWGVVLGALALVGAPHMLRSAVVERRTKKALDAELGVILGRTGDHR